jgi:hypothetical protein
MAGAAGRHGPLMWEFQPRGDLARTTTAVDSCSLATSEKTAADSSRQQPTAAAQSLQNRHTAIGPRGGPLLTTAADSGLYCSATLVTATKACAGHISCKAVPSIVRSATRPFLAAQLDLIWQRNSPRDEADLPG